MFTKISLVSLLSTFSKWRTLVFLFCACLECRRRFYNFRGVRTMYWVTFWRLSKARRLQIWIMLWTGRNATASAGLMMFESANSSSWLNIFTSWVGEFVSQRYTRNKNLSIPVRVRTVRLRITRNASLKTVYKVMVSAVATCPSTFSFRHRQFTFAKMILLW